ncbi:MAG TPA: hypothetical protein VKQ72_01275, partial [Aggregatilineales bacterium]|nr:hypothetical protein [Aggregatilineales bacterium]
MVVASKNHVNQVVSVAAQRDDARVTFTDVGIFSGPIGTPLMEYVKVAFPPDHPEQPVIAALVDSDLRELTFPIERDVTVRPVNLLSSDGHRIYRRSLVFLMTTAAAEVLPGVKIEVMHSLTSGGFYCEALKRPNFSEDELALIRTRMREIVAEDAPIVRKHMPLEEARAMFKARGDDDKVRLLEFREKEYLTVYSLRDNLDYFFGYMAASTGVLRLFDLFTTGQGFILQYPRPEAPSSLSPYKESKQLESIFLQTEKWLDVMGIEDVGQLNEAIKGGRIREEILVAEALQTRHLSEIAAAIAERHAQGTRLVLIAGPSSAGKTTFSKRLAVQLMAYGIQPYALGMDNYFVDREFTPRDSNGEYDFEALEALDLKRLNRDLLNLMQRQPVQLPCFDFRLGKSLPGDVITLTDDHIIIAEGIHGM